MQDRYDLVIVGAGPGGLAAAVTADAHGLSVLILNEQAHLGGQIYHSIETLRAENKPILGSDYLHGKGLIAAFKKSDVTYISGACVLNIESDRSVSCAIGEEIRVVRTDHVIVSAGAMERPVPIPGWTTPGVMGAAAVDVLLKQSDLIPSGKVVFAGSGPLLLSVTCHLIDCGVKVSAILDTSRFDNGFQALPHLPGALSNPGMLLKGLLMLLKIRKAGVRVIRGAKGIEAIGGDQVTAVSFSRGGQRQTIETDLLLLHEGVIPNTQLSRVAGCRHEWFEPHRYWKPVVDQWGRSSVDGLSLVGDCTGIFGAMAAEHAGRMAGLDAACLCGVITRAKRDTAATPYQIARKKALRFRPFIDALYPPNRAMILPTRPETIVCRCEEVTLGEIWEALDMGFDLPPTVKNKTRSGMGRCQGRMCGPILTEILADRHGTKPGEVGYFHIRPMIKPVTLSRLGAMQIAGGDTQPQS